MYTQEYISYDTVVICWLRQNSKEPSVKSICDTWDELRAAYSYEK